MNRPPRLSPPQCAALRLLTTLAPLSSAEVARGLSISHPHACVTLRALQRRGLVAWVHPPARSRTGGYRAHHASRLTARGLFWAVRPSIVIRSPRHMLELHEAARRVLREPALLEMNGRAA